MLTHRFTVAITDTQAATLEALRLRWALPSRAAVIREAVQRAALDDLVRSHAALAVEPGAFRRALDTEGRFLGLGPGVRSDQLPTDPTDPEDATP